MDFKGPYLVMSCIGIMHEETSSPLFHEAWVNSIFECFVAEPHSSIGNVADLRLGGRSANIFFQGLMIVIATGFIPLSLLSVVSTMVMWESSQWLGKNIVRGTV